MRALCEYIADVEIVPVGADVPPSLQTLPHIGAL